LSESVPLDEATNAKLEQWSKKLGILSVTLRSQLLSLVTHLKSMPQYQGRSEEFYIARARHLLATKYAAAMRVRAEAFIGVFFSVGDKVDFNRAMRETALSIYKQNPAQAVASGLIKVDPTTGEPIVIDTREWLVEPSEGRRGRRNPQYGKPLQPFYQKSCFGIAKKFGEQDLKFTSFTLRGEQADLEVPENAPVKFRANLRGETEHSFILTSSVATKFEPIDEPAFREWSLERTVEMLDNLPIKVTPVKLEEYFEKHRREAIVPCVLEGDLVGVREEETASGNIMTMWSDVEEDIDLPPATVFLSKKAFEAIKDLGLGSRCLVIGTLRPGQDLATGEMTRVLMTGFSVFVKYPVSKEESLLEVEKKVTA